MLENILKKIGNVSGKALGYGGVLLMSYLPMAALPVIPFVAGCGDSKSRSYEVPIDWVYVYSFDEREPGSAQVGIPTDFIVTILANGEEDRVINGIFYIDWGDGEEIYSDSFKFNPSSDSKIFEIDHNYKKFGIFTAKIWAECIDPNNENVLDNNELYQDVSVVPQKLLNILLNGR